MKQRLKELGVRGQGSGVRETPDTQHPTPSTQHPTLSTQLFRDTEGSQLLEFALALPLLAVLAIGIMDFGQAYNTKHYLTNAAREAARITISEPTCTPCDGSCTTNNRTPCSLQAAADAAKQYMTNAGLNTASCIDPTTPSSPGTLTWTWACSGVSLTIDRGFSFVSGGTTVLSTQVTLSYPYTWTFGRIIGLLVSGATVSLPTTLTTTSVMQNLTT